MRFIIKLSRFTSIVVAMVLFAVMFAMPADCSVTAGTSLFGRGHFRLSGYAGAASALNQTYTLVGLGAGYYLLNGVELGMDGEAWFGHDPNIYKLTPQIRYVFYRAERLMPYVGAFYRRTMYEGLSDLNSYGGRAGIFSPLGGKGYAGIGMVYEKLVDCNDNIYSSCSSTYPEISFSIGF